MILSKVIQLNFENDIEQWDEKILIENIRMNMSIYIWKNEYKKTSVEILIWKYYYKNIDMKILT